MKKFILALFLVSSAGLCFAQEVIATHEVADAHEIEDQALVAQVAATQEIDSDRFSMEVSVGIAVHGTKSPTPHDFPKGTNNVTTDRSVTSSTVVGLGMTFPVHKFVGLTLDADLFFGGDLSGNSGSQSATVSLFGANVLFGPSIYLYKYRTFRIPLTVGVHMAYWDSTAWIPNLNVDDGSGTAWIRYNDIQVGLGLGVGIHFYFTHNAYMISRVNVNVDFFRWHRIRSSSGAATGAGTATTGTITDEKHTELSAGWGVKPTIGLGLKF